MSEAEAVLLRVEAGARGYRLAFCAAIGGLATLVAANAWRGVDDLITTKSIDVVGDSGSVGYVNVKDGRPLIATMRGSNILSTLGGHSSGAGYFALRNADDNTMMMLGTAKNGGGSMSVNRPTGDEMANASPNVTNAGSLFIDNSAGTLIGEINGDKKNGGAIVLHDSTGKEIARVHQ